MSNLRPPWRPGARKPDARQRDARQPDARQRDARQIRPGAVSSPVERALEQYARAELEPDPASLARGRAAIVVRFDRAAAAWGPTTDARPAGATDAVAVGPGARAGAAAGRTWPWSGAPLRVRMAAALAGAALVVSGAGAAFAASGPGGPLYATRLDIETFTLPPAGSAAWFNAETGRLGARLSEAESAAGAGNANAVEAAVGAYRSILSQTVAAADTSAPGTVPPGLTRALDRHAELLSSLLARAPAQAHAALRAALGELQGAVAASGSPSLSSTPGSGTAPGNATPPAAGNPGSAAGPQRTHPPAAHTPPPKSRGGKGAEPSPTATPEAARWGTSRPVTAHETVGHRGRGLGHQVVLAGFAIRAGHAPR